MDFDNASDALNRKIFSKSRKISISLRDAIRMHSLSSGQGNRKKIPDA